MNKTLFKKVKKAISELKSEGKKEITTPNIHSKTYVRKHYSLTSVQAFIHRYHLELNLKRKGKRPCYTRASGRASLLRVYEIT